MSVQPLPSSPSHSPQHDPNRTPTFDPTQWYRLLNASNPHKPCLDVINEGGEFNSTGSLKMAEEGYYSGQYWQFKPSSTAATCLSPPGNAIGPFILRTWWLGPLRTLAVSTPPSETGLDVPMLPRPEDGGARGSEWGVGCWGDGTVFVGCEVSGRFKVLDVGQDGRQVVLQERDEGRLTQRWRVESIRSIREEENSPRPDRGVAHL